jgi:hypothetical protein
VFDLDVDMNIDGPAPRSKPDVPGSSPGPKPELDIEEDKEDELGAEMIADRERSCSCLCWISSV